MRKQYKMPPDLPGINLKDPLIIKHEGDPIVKARTAHLHRLLEQREAILKKDYVVNAMLIGDIKTVDEEFSRNTTAIHETFEAVVKRAQEVSDNNLTKWISKITLFASLVAALTGIVSSFK